MSLTDTCEACGRSDHRDCTCPVCCSEPTPIAGEINADDEVTMSINGGPTVPLSALTDVADELAGRRRRAQGELAGMPAAVPAPVFQGKEYRSLKLALSGGIAFHVFDQAASDYALDLESEAPFEMVVRGRIGGFAWRTRWKEGVPIRKLTVRFEVDEIDGAPETTA